MHTHYSEVAMSYCHYSCSLADIVLCIILHCLYFERSLVILQH